MLQKSKSRKIVQLRYLIMLPLICAMVTYTSCSQERDLSSEMSLSEKIADLERAIESADSISEEDATSLMRLGNKIGITSQVEREVAGVPFAAMDKIPTYPGCEDLSGNDAKQCFTQKIATFIIENFDNEVIKASGLEGKQRIAVQFVITDNGLVTDVKAKAATPELGVEAERVVGDLPQMLPGEKDGKTVKVLYSLPLIIAMGE